jgi:2,3-bisphosphoglycerate-independent phosphoglycerate mutase
MSTSTKSKVVLIVLDGWGVTNKYRGNAIASAKTPFYDSLIDNYPNTVIESSGEAVGLPDGQMGTSEVNHMTIGASKVLYQDLVRISNKIKDGTFFDNPSFIKAFDQVKAHNSTLHIKGLLGPGGVHSHSDHMVALLEAAKKHGVQKVYLHVFTDGRDVRPSSAKIYLEQLESEIKRIGLGSIASISGRYYAMDRDHNWTRTDKTFDVMTKRVGPKYKSALEALEDSYQKSITDEYVEPACIEVGPGEEGAVCSHDAVIFVNFRNDRTRQLTERFLEKGPSDLLYVTMTQYAPDYQVEVAYPIEDAGSTIGQVISDHGLKQLRVTETEKFPHMTFFLNCKREEAYEGEDRMMFDSNSDIKTHDEKPEMRTLDIAQFIVNDLKSGAHDAIFANLCNADMVGHTSNVEAAIIGVETIDKALSMIIPVALDNSYTVMITADHGNAEEMRDKSTGELLSAHTTNLVPFILVDKEHTKLKHSVGSLVDVGATVLTALKLKVPSDMTGKSFI